MAAYRSSCVGGVQLLEEEAVVVEVGSWAFGMTIASKMSMAVEVGEPEVEALRLSEFSCSCLLPS